MSQEKTIHKETRVIDLTLGELLNALQTESAFRLPQAFNEKQEDEFGGIDLAEKITGLARQTIYGRTSSKCKNPIPHYKPTPKTLRFSKKELIDWLRRNKPKTVEEIDQVAGSFLSRPARRKTPEK